MSRTRILDAAMKATRICRWFADCSPWISSDATPGASDRNETELAALFAVTAIGSAQVTCFYSPKPEETDRQGASCRLAFNVANGVSATLGTSGNKIISNDPVLIETIKLIPESWAALASDS